MSTTEKVVFYKENPFETRYFELQMKYQVLDEKYSILQEKYEQLCNHTERLNETIASYEMKLKEGSRKIDSEANYWSERYYQLLKENIELLEKLKQKE